MTPLMMLMVFLLLVLSVVIASVMAILTGDKGGGNGDDLTMAMMIMMGEEEAVQVRKRPFLGHPCLLWKAFTQEQQHDKTLHCGKQLWTTGVWIMLQHVSLQLFDGCFTYGCWPKVKWLPKYFEWECEVASRTQNRAKLLKHIQWDTFTCSTVVTKWPICSEDQTNTFLSDLPQKVHEQNYTEVYW